MLEKGSLKAWQRRFITPKASAEDHMRFNSLALYYAI